MADETEEFKRYNPPDAASAPTYYANDVLISMGNSDITLTFGVDLSSDTPNIHSGTKAHIVMTHDNFLRLVPFFQTRFDFLKHLYGRITPSLFDITREQFDAATPLLRGEPIDEE